MQGDERHSESAIQCILVMLILSYPIPSSHLPTTAPLCVVTAPILGLGFLISACC